jgi:predicted Zn-dependent protease
MKVYIDGRADTVYDAATYENYLTVLNHKPGWLDLVEGSDADFVLWDRRGDLALPKRLVATGRWRVLYDDPMSVFLARVGVALPDPLVMPAESSWHLDKLGDDLLRAGRFAEAVDAFARARALPPHPRSACLGLARAQARAGRDDDATRTLESCRRDFPTPEIDDALRRIGEASAR